MTKPKNPSGFRPLLSSPANLAKIAWPVLASQKLDGVRALVRDSVVYSRTLKEIPNEHVQYQFGRPEFNGFDGELIVGSPVDPAVYNTTQSAVMSHHGCPDVFFHVFDDFSDPDLPFESRVEALTNRVLDLGETGRAEHLKLVIPHEVTCLEDAESLYSDFLDQGYEGIMFRSPDGLYKYGRSTEREGILLKHKPVHDSDAVILSVFEQMQNNNTATVDALGFTTRSSHAENRMGKGTLGGFTARDVHTGVEFNVGIFTGVTAEERKDLWSKKESLVGKTFKYSSLSVGVKTRPRHPRFIGWRDQIDI